jgi:hypothetical protein
MKRKNRKSFVFSSNFKKIAFNSLFIALVGIFLLPNTAFFSSITEENIILLTNRERQKAGLSALTANQHLASAAYAKGRAIFERQEFSHHLENRAFSSWIRDAGYDYSHVGENLAIDFITSEGTVRAWMESESHRRNILNRDYRETGVAVIEGNFNGHDAILIVQIFGSPMVKPKAGPLLSAENSSGDHRPADENGSPTGLVGDARFKFSKDWNPLQRSDLAVIVILAFFSSLVSELIVSFRLHYRVQK